MHLANFGWFASAERNLVFGINDFDETLPGAKEWDLKRLAASVVVAGRFGGADKVLCEEAARAAVRSYRKRMRVYAPSRATPHSSPATLARAKAWTRLLPVSPRPMPSRPTAITTPLSWRPSRSGFRWRRQREVTEATKLHFGYRLAVGDAGLIQFFDALACGNRRG